MGLLCFMLDLRSVSPQLLRDLKQVNTILFSLIFLNSYSICHLSLSHQYLLQLANLYAISSGRGESRSENLRDRIGLCYIHRNRNSCSNELKIAYSPRGNFILRDFHHAVNNLPADSFLPELSDSGTICGSDIIFARLLSNEVLYSWGSKDIARKVIFIGSCLIENINAMRKILMDAADKCVSVEFLMLQQETSQQNNISENVKDFVNSICDLEYCLLQTIHPDPRVLCGLVKRWLQELMDDLEEPMQAVFLFKSNLVGSMNKIFCNLFASVNEIIDGFSPCQTCRCHGLPLDSAVGSKIGRSSSCPVTCNVLETGDLIENAVKVGDQTVLFLPSFQNCPKLRQVSAPIAFNVIERTNLGAVCEGAIIGSSYILTPSAGHNLEAAPDEYDKSELNTQLFQGLCRALYSLDQGLVCSSNCNIETMKEATFHRFYIVQPSDSGPLLLRRLAGSEEILPVPDAIRSIDSAVVPKEIENSVHASLLKMELRDYNPLLHERGFHPKLNLLVKESLQFGLIPLKRKGTSSLPKSPKVEPSEATVLLASTKEALEVEILAKTKPSEEIVPLASTKKALKVEEQTPQLTQAIEEDKAAACLTEEWEQLFVNEVCEIQSPTCISKSKMEKKVMSLSDSNRPLDEKTSRILERLEAPKQLKTKGSSPIVISSFSSNVSVLPMKKPLVPFLPNHVTEQGSSSTQPMMRPSFQKLKRKQR